MAEGVVAKEALGLFVGIEKGLLSLENRTSPIYTHTLYLSPPRALHRRNITSSSLSLHHFFCTFTVTF